MDGSIFSFLICVYLIGWIELGVAENSAALGMLWPIYLPIRGLVEAWRRLRE